MEGLYLGTDITPSPAWANLERAGHQGRLVLRFQTMDAQRLDQLDSQFDFAISLFSLEHIPDDVVAVRQLAMRLKVGSYAVVVVPSRWSFLLYGRHGYRHYSCGSVMALMREAHLEIVQLVPLGGLASFAFHLAWRSWARLANWMLRPVLYCAAGGGSGKMQQRWPHLLYSLENTQYLPLTHPWGRKLYRTLTNTVVWLDKVLPLCESGYAVLVRKNSNQVREERK